MIPLATVRKTSIIAAAILGGAACHRTPPAVTPASASPSASTNDDGARARADSIARAEAARREAIARANARADSLRRAADAMRLAETNARARLVEPIHFDFDRAEILASDRALLDGKASILNANGSLKLRIDGNTDDRGSAEYNLALGTRRAAEARRYLIEHGVDGARLAITSNGEERPICAEHNEACWSRNRRAEFVIVEGGDRITASR